MLNMETGFKDVYFTNWLTIGNIYHEKLEVTLSLATFFSTNNPTPSCTYGIQRSETAS